jgi:hypothetical protein
MRWLGSRVVDVVALAYAVGVRLTGRRRRT